MCFLLINKATYISYIQYIASPNIKLPKLNFKL